MCSVVGPRCSLDRQRPPSACHPCVLVTLCWLLSSFSTSPWNSGDSWASPPVLIAGKRLPPLTAHGLRVKPGVEFALFGGAPPLWGPPLPSCVPSSCTAPTCDGLEKVRVVLQVVVALIVVGSFAECTALSVSQEILRQGLLQVQDGGGRLLLAVKADTQPKLALQGDVERRAGAQ